MNMQIKKRHLEVDGLKTSYFEAGEGENLIFFDGLFSSVVVCGSFIKELSKKYKVYALDLPGFGGTETPKEIWSIDDYADFVLNFTDAFKIKKPIVCACSAGCLIGINLAFKNKIKKLILVDSAGLKLPFSKRELFFRLFVVKTLKELILFRRFPRVSMMMLLNLREVVKGIFNRKIKKIIEKNIEVSYEKELKNIKIPVTIIWGEDDEILSLDYARRLNKLIKNSKLIIVKGNHDWLVLEYEQAGKLVKEGLI